MAGAYNGLQAQFLQLEECAKFVHCAAHNVNLVVNDAVKGVPEITIFLNTLERLYKFFHVSV